MTNPSNCSPPPWTNHSRINIKLGPTALHYIDETSKFTGAPVDVVSGPGLTNVALSAKLISEDAATDFDEYQANPSPKVSEIRHI